MIRFVLENLVLANIVYVATWIRLKFDKNN